MAAESLLETVARLDEARQRRVLGLFKVERFGAFVRAVDSGADIVGMVTSPPLVRSTLVQMLIRRVRRRGVPVTRLSPEVFRGHARAARASGIIAVIRQAWGSLSPAGTWIAADRIRSGGNLGCILRTCEACGVRGLIVAGSVDPFAPDVVRASMGGVFGLQFVRAGWRPLRAWASEHRVPLVGTSPAAAVAWDRYPYPEPMVLCIGDERDGLGRVLNLCDVSLRIPIRGRADSLNVATATGVVLYEALRRRRLVPGPARR